MSASPAAPAFEAGEDAGAARAADVKAARAAAMQRLASTDIPNALHELGQKHTYVNDVIQWCESSYMSGNKKEVQAQTQEYVVDALGSVAKEVEETSAKLAEFLKLQSDSVDTLAIQLDVVKERLAVAKAANAEARLAKFRPTEPRPKREAAKEALGDAEREAAMPAVVAYERDLSARLSAFDDVGTCLQKRN
jgi:hypothetical protein